MPIVVSSWSMSAWLPLFGGKKWSLFLVARKQGIGPEHEFMGDIWIITLFWWLWNGQLDRIFVNVSCILSSIFIFLWFSPFSSPSPLPSCTSFSYFPLFLIFSILLRLLQELFSNSINLLILCRPRCRSPLLPSPAPPWPLSLFIFYLPLHFQAWFLSWDVF